MTPIKSICRKKKSVRRWRDELELMLTKYLRATPSPTNQKRTIKPDIPRIRTHDLSDDMVSAQNIQAINCKGNHRRTASFSWPTKAWTERIWQARLTRLYSHWCQIHMLSGKLRWTTSPSNPPEVLTNLFLQTFLWHLPRPLGAWSESKLGVKCADLRSSSIEWILAHVRTPTKAWLICSITHSDKHPLVQNLMMNHALHEIQPSTT